MHFGASAGRADARRRDAGDAATSSRSGNAADVRPPPRLQEVTVQFRGRPSGKIVIQPVNCDTGPGVFLPITYVMAADPDATIVIFPSDHFVSPEGEFLKAVRSAVLAAESLQNRLVLLGVAPDGAEPDYGWIEPDGNLTPCAGYCVRGVRAFIEKPSAPGALELRARGALWNTLVVTAKVKTVWELGWRYFPAMMHQFTRLLEAIGTKQEREVMESVYKALPVRNFSVDLLSRAIDSIAVMELRSVLWSDWGRPERIAGTPLHIGKQPSFSLEHLVACEATCIGAFSLHAGSGPLVNHESQLAANSAI